MMCYFSIGPSVTDFVSSQILLSLYFIEKSVKLCCSKSITTLLSHCISILSYCYCLVLVVYLNTLAYSALVIHTFCTNVHMDIWYRKLYTHCKYVLFCLVHSVNATVCSVVCWLLKHLSIAQVRFKTILGSVYSYCTCVLHGLDINKYDGTS